MERSQLNWLDLMPCSTKIRYTLCFLGFKGATTAFDIQFVDTITLIHRRMFKINRAACTEGMWERCTKKAATHEQKSWENPIRHRFDVGCSRLRWGRGVASLVVPVSANVCPMSVQIPMFLTALRPKASVPPLCLKRFRKLIHIASFNVTAFE